MKAPVVPSRSPTGVQSRRGLAVVLVAALAACSSAPAAADGAGDGVQRIGRYGRLELAVDVAHPGRAADDVGIEGRFTAPSGRVIHTGGFASGGRFAVRFAPTELGPYRYEVWADAGSGRRRVASGRFEAVASDAHGFVRVDPVERTHLLRDDGTPFVILGENRINVFDPSWNWEHLGIRDYVAHMASLGMTTLRVFVFSDCENEEAPDRVQLGCLEPAVGRFDQAAARRFDEIMEASQEHGIYVVLTLFAIGFTPAPDTWKSWDDNPYAAARGGPAATPSDFFTRPEVRALAARRVRYAVDRWGAFTHLLAVDLLNEPEWDGPIPEATWIPWAEDMAAAERAADPYGHLVTVGPVGLHWNLAGDEWPWYSSPSNDLVEWHLYGAATYEPRAHALEMTRKVDETLAAGKPVFCGEFAYGGEDHATYDHTHDGIWALAFSGAGAVAHSAPPFNLDSDELMTPERGAHLRVLREFLDGLDWDRGLEPRHYLAATPADTRVWQLGASDYRALWILGPAAGYGSTVDGATVTVPDLAAGTYAVEWWDDVRGLLVGASRLSHRGGPVTLAVPGFARHLAAKIVPDEAAPPVAPPRS